MESLFIIPMRHIDKDWNLASLDYDFCPFEYCEEVLDIPLEDIYEANLTAQGIELSILCTNDTFSEDWFIQLNRIANHPQVA